MNLRLALRALLAMLIAIPCTTTRADDTTAAEREFFETRVRPLLAEHCYRCHGPERQKAHLRLDNRSALLKGGDSGPAVVPGSIAKSLLAKAISYQDAELRMPPKGKLTDDAITNLNRWIEGGAFWPDEKPITTANTKEFDLRERSKHWSLQPLQQAAPPKVRGEHWPRSPVDHFILAKLEAAGLTPAASATPRTLLRRLSFDVLGLPPTPQEIAAFETRCAELKTPGDTRIPHKAIEEVVDRLLASPHYGERWGRHWLDLVRFAETRGHEFDFEIPEAHLYRDYVIRALNADVPYDQFVMEHIAGDLLTQPRLHPEQHFNESILGTGFFFLGEGKHSPVDVRGDQADRRDNQIDVFAKTFLGLTVACARCHDHKFDAISTDDYYGLAGIIESSRFQRAFIDDPALWKSKLGELRAVQRPLHDMATKQAAAALRAQLERLSELFPVARVPGKNDWQLLGDGKGLTNAADFAARRAAAVKRLRDQQAQLQTAVDEYAGPTKGFADWIRTGPAFEHGDVGITLDEKTGQLRSVVPPEQLHSGRVSARLEGMLQSPTFTIATKQIHYLAAGKSAKINLIIDGFQLIRSPIYGGLTTALNHGDQLRWLTMDVSMWQGHRAYIEVLDDGPGFATLDRVVFANSGPPALPPNQLVLSLLADEQAASPADLAKSYRKNLAEIVDQLAAGTLLKQPDASERVELLNWMLQTAPAQPNEELTRLLAEQQRAEAMLPAPRRALAMLDGTPVNENVFIRGNHKKPGAEVPRRFLEVFGGKDAPTPTGSGRLELAQRLVNPNLTPIVPRVLANRLWKHHFGEGIVRSTDDFGVLGQTPSHPELLDFLAGELVRNGWSMKKLHRLILLSSTYQMSSDSADARAIEIDPTNRLLQHMPIRRLEAEVIRDAMLAVSGRLDRTLYGPGVMPHLTPFMAGRGRPGASGPLDGNGRRSIYINVRRNFLTPLFVAFDYPTPFSTIGRRTVSNVPAQALSMMNNPLVMQQAEIWARRVLGQPRMSTEERVQQMYEAAFARPATARELQDALDFVSEQTTAYGREDLAWSDLGHVLFNLKEFIFIQ